MQNEQQWIFTEEELLHTPSIEDGMAPEQEKEMRYKGMTFIYQVGAMLKLRKSAPTSIMKSVPK